MKRIEPRPEWPETWRTSFHYDCLEVWGRRQRSGPALLYAARRTQALELVRRACPPPARVLDVAAAQGNFTLALAEAGYEVTWNDLRADLEGYVRLKHEHGIVHYAPGNILDLALPDAFDVVLMTEVIEHVAHPDRFLRAIAEYVRPGGHVVITTPNGRFWRNPLPRFSEWPTPEDFEACQFSPDADGHIFLLHPDEIEPLARRAGLDVCELRLFTNPLKAGFSGTAWLLRVLPNVVVEMVEHLTTLLPRPIRERAFVGMAVLLQRPG